MSTAPGVIVDRRWEDFIANHPDATIFHHPAWSIVLAKCYGYRPSLLTREDAPGQIVAGLPLMEVRSWLTGRRGVALPFSDFCPPLRTGPTTDDDLIKEIQAVRQRQNWPRVEIHWPLEERAGVHSSESMFRHVTHLDRDPERVFRRFKKTQVQQRIRQAEQAGVVVRKGETLNDLQMFYGLHLRTRKRLGAPVQPMRFFRILWEELMSQGLGFVLLAQRESQLLAAAVFLHWNKVVTYKYGASEPAFWDLRPNHLVFWNAVRWGCEHGYAEFDWGKTELENKGLRQFKRSWGSEESVTHYSVVAERAPARSVKGYSHFLAPVIRRSPVWVGRAVGELLYGHFG